MIVYKMIWISVVLLLVVTESLNQELTKEETVDRVKRSHQGDTELSTRVSLQKKVHKLQNANPSNLHVQNVGLIPLAHKFEEKILLPDVNCPGNSKLNLRLDPAKVLITKERPANNVLVSPRSANYPVHFYMLDKKHNINEPKGISPADKTRPMVVNPKPDNAILTKQVSKEVKHSDVKKSEIANSDLPSPKPTEARTSSKKDQDKDASQIDISEVNKTLELNMTKNEHAHIENKTDVPLTVNKDLISNVEDNKSNFIVDLNSTEINKKDNNDGDITLIAVYEPPEAVYVNESNQTDTQYRSNLNEKSEINNHNLYEVIIDKDQYNQSIIDVITKSKDEVPVNINDNLQASRNSIDTNEYTYQGKYENSDNSDVMDSDCTCIDAPYVYSVQNKITIPAQYEGLPRNAPSNYYDKQYDFLSGPRTNKQMKIINNLSFVYGDKMDQNENDRISRVWRNMKTGTNNKLGNINVNLSCRNAKIPYRGNYYYTPQPLIDWNGCYAIQNMRMASPYYLYYYPRRYYYYY